MKQGSLRRGARHLRAILVRGVPGGILPVRRAGTSPSTTSFGARHEVLEGRTLFSVGANLDLAIGELIRGAHGFVDIWSPVDKVVAPRGGKSFLHARAKRPYSLDRADLRETLKLAPMEFTPAAGKPLELALPTPGGDVSRFAIVEAPVMDPPSPRSSPASRRTAARGSTTPPPRSASTTPRKASTPRCCRRPVRSRSIPIST